MDIKILETGCCCTGNLEKLVHQALEETKVQAEVERLTDLQDLLKYDILMPPALVIDGEVKLTGKSISLKDIVKVLTK